MHQLTNDNSVNSSYVKGSFGSLVFGSLSFKAVLAHQLICHEPPHNSPDLITDTIAPNRAKILQLKHNKKH